MDSLDKGTVSDKLEYFSYQYFHVVPIRPVEFLDPLISTSEARPVAGASLQRQINVRDQRVLRRPRRQIHVIEK